MRIKLDSLGGVVPIRDDRLLPDSNAAYARDCYLYSGAAQGFPTPRLIYTASLGTGFVYRIPTVYNDTTHMLDALFVEFPNAYTDVLRPAVVGDQYQRYYWAAPGAVPQYNTYDRLAAGQPAWVLGVPPGNAPTVSVANGVSATLTSRAYVTTLTTAYGEEGPPSSPFNVSSVPIDSTFNLTLTPYVDATRNVTTVNIYRTVTSTAGVASYFRVASLPADTAIYTDTATDAAVASNQILESATWFAPPSDFEGWVTMANGMVAAWRGKEIWFCEPYRFHAWPPNYAISVNYNIIGLGVSGQTLIVCTDGYPYAVTGINPASMSSAMINTFEPCLSRGSILSTPEGVYYASPNGLMVAAQGQLLNTTLNIFSKDKWQRDVPLAAMTAARLGSGYYAFGTQRLGAFQANAFNSNAFEQTDSTFSYTGLFIDPSNGGVTTFLSTDEPTTRVYNDTWSGETFLLRGRNLYWLDQGSTSQPKEPYLWRSKVFQVIFPHNFQALKAYWTIDAATSATITLAPTPNADLVQTYDPTTQYGLLRLYADDRLVWTREIRTSAELMRLPAGFKANYWQLEFEGVAQLFALHVATSAKELREI